MSNYVLKYSRDERVKYISHLDFVRMFHRTIRRTDIPFVFSQGFNPHPVMTVSQPLSVGVTSECEYMKVGFDGIYKGKELCRRINEALPPGFEIKAARLVNGKEIDLTKINRAEYLVEVECSGDIDVEGFLANKELLVMKKSKSGEKESDIRPHIFNVELVSKTENEAVFKMELSVGNDYNLKPQVVLNAMEKYLPDFKTGFSVVHRTNMTIDGEDIL